MSSHNRFRSFILVSLLVVAVPTLSASAVVPAVDQQIDKPVTALPYTGRLTGTDGQPVSDGTYDFIFNLYDAQIGGTALWSETQTAVTVRAGAFDTVMGKITALPKEVSDRKESWLSISVRGPGETAFTLLNPRQLITAPSGGSGLACPHSHFYDYWTGVSSIYGLEVDNNAGTGDAIRAYSHSNVYNYAGVYAINSGGSITSSGSGGSGIYADSANGYAGYFVSQNYRALYAKGAVGWYAGFIENPSGSANPGLYVNGSLWVTGAKTGYVTDAAINDGPERLETGDVVVITGVADPIAGQIPVIRVRKASAAGSTAVAGVVDQGVVMQKGAQDTEAAPGVVGHEAHIADKTAIQPGEYLLIVTLGAYKGVKVDALSGPIHVGDALVASGNGGYAAASADPKLNTVIGKALGELKSGTGLIPVLVTLK